MTIYLDTSLIVGALTVEPRSAEARAAMAVDPAAVPAISPWVVTEFAATLSRKARMGLIGPVENARLLGQFAQLRASAWTLLDIRSSHYDDAAVIAGRSDIALQAGDALHLAIAVAASAEIWTMDRGLATAAERLGFAARLI